MRFSGSMEIAAPRDRVVACFADPTMLGEWQDGFVRKEPVSGTPGATGAVARMHYAHRDREMVLTETITANNLPESFEASYHHKAMDNTMACRFTALDDHTTRYDYEFEYTRLDWVMPRLIALVYPAMYRKQGEKWLRQFKEFVERG